MRLNNKLIIEEINHAITDYNSFKPMDIEFGLESSTESEREPINLITNGEIKDEDLKKLTTLSINFSNIPKEEINQFYEELSRLLEVMKLTNLTIYSDDKNIISNVDMTFLSKVNRDLKWLSISDIDLSNVNANIFNQFENLQFLNLKNNNIKDFEILSKLNEQVRVLIDNPMTNVSINEVINKIKSHKDNLFFAPCSVFNAMFKALEYKELNLEVYEIPDERLDEVIHFLNENEIKVELSSKEIARLNERPEKIKNIYSCKLNGTKDVSTKYLEEHPEIVAIETIDYYNSEMPTYSYTREEFLQIRRKIDGIKQQIVFPEENDIDREKKIFMQVYKILGKMIEYDYYAISEEGREDSELQQSCASLKGGLLKGKAVCAGYAYILKNVLEEVGIETYYISADPDKSNEFYCAERDSNGHAWNSVVLDGEEYYCDLTWDAPSIQMNNYPLRYCLRDWDSFGHNLYIDEHKSKVKRMYY